MLCLLLWLLPILSAAGAHAHGSFATRPEVRTFIAEMQERHGFDSAELNRTFSHARSLSAVIRAVRPPHLPTARSWQAYRAGHVDARRIALGLRFWQEHREVLADASAQSGVPEEIIVAIIGIETIYGRFTGNFGTLSTLATLAFDYPMTHPVKSPARAAFFRNELEEFLLLSRETHRDPLSFRGSYAGALGLPQFLPSSIRRYAVDGNHDHHIDLADSPADSIASVANFLRMHGWEKGGPITVATQVEGENYTMLIDEGILPRRNAADLAGFGVTGPAVSTVSPLAIQPAALIDLATPGQPTEYHLGFRNFYVLTRYNRSSFYAMAVHELAQTLKAAR